MMHYGYYPHSLFGPVGTILLWILVVWAIIHLVRHFRGGPGRLHRHFGEYNESALDIVKKRYAKGEITKDEFESIKKDIQP